MRHPDIAHLLSVVLLLTAGHMILGPTLRVITKDWYGFSGTDSTWAFAAWMFVGVMVQGGAIRPTVKRFGERKTIVLGGLILAAGFGVVALHPSIGGFWAAAVLIAIGGSLADPALRGLISRNTAAADHGAVQGLHQSVTAFGRGISYLMAGLLYDLISPATPFLVGGSLVLISVVILLGRRSKPVPEY